MSDSTNDILSTGTDLLTSPATAGITSITSADGTVAVTMGTDVQTGDAAADLSVAAAIAVETLERQMADEDILASIGTISAAEIEALE